MKEPFSSKIKRWGFNFFPAYRRTGGRLAYLDSNWSRVDLKLPLNWKTKNYVGTTFGGSMFGAVDPIYMIMLIKRLGPEYSVWDKSARINFKKPGKGTLYATCKILDDELNTIRQILETESTTERTYHIELKNDDSEVCAIIDKTIHIRRKNDD